MAGAEIRAPSCKCTPGEGERYTIGRLHFGPAPNAHRGECIRLFGVLLLQAGLCLRLRYGLHCEATQMKRIVSHISTLHKALAYITPLQYMTILSGLRFSYGNVHAILYDYQNHTFSISIFIVIHFDLPYNLEDNSKAQTGAQTVF